MSDDDEFRTRRQLRMKVTAWVVIIALVIVGGGATVISLLFG
ncbi:MAG: hypothetical protein NT132_13260 [Microbacterium sp.]|nr:hypothetical protein [Microbacterium sp.]MCX6503346.1 hypothetical protein [Microbacterium sp.]